MTRPRVTVVGGGLSGITAALDGAAAGAEVTLLESRGRLGGAAYSFARDGLRVDNGQHVFLRCCTAYTALLERLGASGMVTMQPRLAIDVLGAAGSRGRLVRSRMPAPLHLAAALARYPFLSPRRRLTVAMTMRALGRVDVEDPANDERGFGDWLRAHGADARSVGVLWELIVRPTLNLTCEDASLAQVAQVFQVGLLHDPAAGDIGHARVPLSDIHDVAARRTLERAGVDVRLRAGVTGIESDGASGFVVRLSGERGETVHGGTVHGDAVVVAVGPARAAGLLPQAAGVDATALRALGASPIVNLHVVYDRRVLDAPFAAGVDTPVQWVFDRTQSAGARDGQYLVVTLSAADAEIEMSGEAVRERYLAALSDLLPAARGATVLRSFVTRDHAATFRAGPGSRALRPAAATALPGLALAGAHTDTGWPATMEGAVRSGHAAARVVWATADAGSNAGAPAPAASTPLAGSRA